jgi:hypothetical protein
MIGPDGKVYLCINNYYFDPNPYSTVYHGEVKIYVFGHKSKESTKNIDNNIQLINLLSEKFPIISELIKLYINLL